MMDTGTYDDIRELVSGETMIVIQTSEWATSSNLKTWTKPSLFVTFINYYLITFEGTFS